MLILGISVCVFEDESPYVSCRRGCYCRKRFKAKALGLPLCCCQREILEKHHPLCLYTRPFAACGMKTYLLSFALLSLVFQPLQDSGPLTLETADLPWLCVCSGALPREGGKETERNVDSCPPVPSCDRCWDPAAVPALALFEALRYPHALLYLILFRCQWVAELSSCSPLFPKGLERSTSYFFLSSWSKPKKSVLYFRGFRSLFLLFAQGDTGNTPLSKSKIQYAPWGSNLPQRGLQVLVFLYEQGSFMLIA